MSQTLIHSFKSPAEKLQELRALSPKLHKTQLWVVAYVNQEGGSPLFDQACADIEASFEGEADAVVLINEWSSLAELEDTLARVRRRYPHVVLGVNYLGDEKEPYGYRDSFRLARDYGLKIVWTDFSGVDLIDEKPSVDLHQIEAERPRNVFYGSGVHMKYSTLKDPTKTVEKSALQALGWVDGVILTGAKTGVAADPEKVRRVREVIGEYPLGLASGVSPENAHTVREHVDFCLVASSLQDTENAKRRIVLDKVRALRRELP